LPSLDYEFANFNSLTDIEKEEIINKLIEIRDTVTYVTLKFRGNKYYGKVSGIYTYSPLWFEGYNFNKEVLKLQIYQGSCEYSKSYLTTTTDVQALIDQSKI
jgi:hypothetical protein